MVSEQLPLFDPGQWANADSLGKAKPLTTFHTAWFFGACNNCIDSRFLAPILASNTIYRSNWAKVKIKSRRKILKYFDGLHRRVRRKRGPKVYFSEIVKYQAPDGIEYAALVSTDRFDNHEALVKFKIKDGLAVEVIVDTDLGLDALEQTGAYPPEG